MARQELTAEMGLSLLVVVVNRGKGSKVLNFACEKGANDASCLFGTGTVNSRMLQMLEMNDVDKEVILIVVPTARETEILNQLNMKFHFERKNHGIAFTVPLAGIMKMKRDTSVRWSHTGESQHTQGDYVALLTIVDKGKAASVVQISQTAGYFGGTIIRARGSAGKLNVVLDMIVEPEKEAVLMVVEGARANHLAALLKQQLHLDQPNRGILIQMGVSQTMGLFQTDQHEG